jgi:hypothetical protein
VIPARYLLHETPSWRYAQRTAWNVRDADATLVLSDGNLGGGTALTVRVARSIGRPCIVVDLNDTGAATTVRSELRALDVRCLNVAGPRESQRPGIGEMARAFLLALFGTSGTPTVLDPERSAQG